VASPIAGPWYSTDRPVVVVAQLDFTDRGPTYPSTNIGDPPGTYDYGCAVIHRLPRPRANVGTLVTLTGSFAPINDVTTGWSTAAFVMSVLPPRTAYATLTPFTYTFHDLRRHALPRRSTSW